MWSIAAASFVAIFVFDVPFPAIVAGAALLGHFGGRIAPERFAVGGGHGANAVHFGAALIDDNTPTPPHARFSRRRLALLGSAALALWLVPMAFLAVRHGLDATSTQIAWFFTKAALLTFGGAYAVLPYV